MKMMMMYVTEVRRCNAGAAGADDVCDRGREV